MKHPIALLLSIPFGYSLGCNLTAFYINQTRKEGDLSYRYSFPHAIPMAHGMPLHEYWELQRRELYEKNK
jgi:hypothetical protein